jgi:predicted Zn-dependent protease
MEVFIAKNLLKQDLSQDAVRRPDVIKATDELVNVLVETAEKDFLAPLRKPNAPTTFPWNVTVVDNPTVNAYCAPGGNVVVFSGLIDFCVEAERQGKLDSAAAAICGVLAHEISHGVLR